MVRLQFGCSEATHRLAIPVSVIEICCRFSVVSLQLGCCIASHRLAIPVSVIEICSRFSVVSLQLGCCIASHRLAIPVSEILVTNKVSLVNFRSTNLITSTHSSIKFMCIKSSSDTRQCSLFSELNTRCITDSDRRYPAICKLLTVTNLSEHLCCASSASSLFSSLIMSNTNDAPMKSTVKKPSKVMKPSEIQNASGLFLMNFFANSLF